MSVVIEESGLPRPTLDRAVEWQLKLADLLDAAEADGFVVTVKQRPLKMLAMGNYETVIGIREVRMQSLTTATAQE